MLDHGGKLREAAVRYGWPLEHWLDLSTGLNPRPYPAPALDPAVWHRLPEHNPGLAAAACAYYGAPRVLAVAGTQAAIQALPRLRPLASVVVAAPSYAEHAHCWRRAGHRVREIAYAELDGWADEADVMVICNPNNPTGASVAPDVLHDWHARLQRRGGWLVVDEAFGDTVPGLSVAGASELPGLIVLRSVGKFFGLAGLRLGFVAAEESLLAMLADYLGPWPVTTAAQEIGCAALLDTTWQQEERVRLAQQGSRMQALLAGHGIRSTGTALFQWWPEPDAKMLHDCMARRGIWVRYFPQAGRGIRLGLPPDEAGWRRLGDALAAWSAGRHTGGGT